MRLAGTGQRPQLTVAAAAVKLRAGDHAIGDVALDITGDGARPMTAKLTSAAPTHTRVDVTMPLSLRDLVRAPPTAAALMRTPFQIRGDVDRLPLAALARVARYRERVGGTLSSHIELRGPARESFGNRDLRRRGRDQRPIPADRRAHRARRQAADVRGARPGHAQGAAAARLAGEPGATGDRGA